jgi:CRP-like cAMP-binding protein
MISKATPISEHPRTTPPSSKSRMQAPPPNLLLGALSPEAWVLLQDHVGEQEFQEGTVLWEAGNKSGLIFFPGSGLISIRVPLKDGHGAEVATIGREGAAGFYGPAVTEAVVQARGRFFTVGSDRFAEAAHQNGEFRRLAALCEGWLLMQSQQIASCNAVHRADARLCRWLLRAGDALGDELIPVIQDTIAQALGIRRTTATLIARHLQMGGLIHYQRGKIAIPDRSKLQAIACDCCHVFARAHWPSELLRTGYSCEAKIGEGR